jgi:hypothetical protein
MGIEEDLRNMFARQSEGSSLPDLQQFRRSLRELRDHPAIREMHAVPGPAMRVWDVIRSCALAILAICAAVFVIVYYRSHNSDIQAQEQLSRTQLIAPLLPALIGDDDEKRARALLLFEQADPALAATTAQRFAQFELNQAQTKMIADRVMPYSKRITAGLEKLQFSRDPDERKVAIWNELLPVLQEAQRSRDDFIAVAIEYRKVLPLLQVAKPNLFQDSYWGELWILTILLDSRVSPAVEAARAVAPAPEAVQHIFQENMTKLSDPEREQFRQAVTFYMKAIKGAS